MEKKKYIKGYHIKRRPNDKGVMVSEKYRNFACQCEKPHKVENFSVCFRCDGQIIEKHEENN